MLKKCTTLSLLLGCAALLPLAATAQAHFRDCVSRTVEQATIILQTSMVASLNGEALQAGDEIAVFTAEGICAGALVWEDRNAALTVWGNDADTLTPKEAGLRVAEPMLFRVWDASLQVEFGKDEPVHVTYSTRAAYLLTSGAFVPGGIYEVAAMTAGAATASATPEAHPSTVLEPNFPNPFRTYTTIQYRLDAEAHVLLELYDEQGRYVRTLVRQHRRAGRHHVSLNGADLSSGLYLVQLTVLGATYTRPLLLVR